MKVLPVQKVHLNKMHIFGTTCFVMYKIKQK